MQRRSFDRSVQHELTKVGVVPDSVVDDQIDIVRIVRRWYSCLVLETKHIGNTCSCSGRMYNRW